MKELFYKLFSATILALGMILGSPVVSSITGDDTSKIQACTPNCNLGAIWVLTIYSVDHCRCTHGGTMCCI